MATKAKTAAKKETPKTSTPAAPTRAKATVMGYSITAVCKWMGINDWTTEAAEKAIAKLKEGDDVKRSTITTGLSDGRSKKYRKGAAELTPAQIKKLENAAK